MPGDSSVLATPSDVAAAVFEGGEAGGGFGSNPVEEDKITETDHEGDRGANSGANRWPRQQTLALLKIRADMDEMFRDSSLKGPLWEEVSRKLADHGYHRNAKKCKEKFENVYKYHKRTREGRTGKSETKTYKFFDQLEAFENHPPHSAPPPVLPAPPPPPKSQISVATSTTLSSWTNSPAMFSPGTVSLTTNPPDIIMSQTILPPTTNPTIGPTSLSSHPMNHSQNSVLPSPLQNLTTHLFSSSTSSSTASDEELEGSRKRRRKWKDFFQRLTRDVIKKQEDLQKKFLETVEKCEHERMAREEAWRMQEMARINREHEILIQERSTAAAKDAAVVAFLQKISGQQNLSMQTQEIPLPKPTVKPSPPLPPQPPAKPEPPASLAPVTNLDVQKRDNGESNAMVLSSSRWPKAEIEALITLRTNLDTKYQENAPKGPLWEDISGGMRRLGYSRSAKRCKEKWENINKYFKKVKESNKKRPEDSKTCPYFDQLDALYKEKNKTEITSVNPAAAGYSVEPISTMKAPLLVRPEQQWPLHQTNTIVGVSEKEFNMDQNMDEGDDLDDDDDVDNGDTDEEEEEEEGGEFEVVANKSASLRNGE